MKNNIKEVLCQTLFIAACCLLVIWVGTSGVRKEYKELKEFKRQAELVNLTYCETCPMCGSTGTIKLKPVDDSWYIECEKFYTKGSEGCGLRTGFYNDKEELIKAWNMLCGIGE